MTATPPCACPGCDPAAIVPEAQRLYALSRCCPVGRERLEAQVHAAPSAPCGDERARRA